MHLSLSLCTVLFRTHSFHCRLGLEKLNTTVDLLYLPYVVCRDTQVLSKALAALGSLQLGSCVCVRVSKDLWYLRSLLPFYLFVHIRVLTLKMQTAANIKFPRIFD